MVSRKLRCESTGSHPRRTTGPGRASKSSSRGPRRVSGFFLHLENPRNSTQVERSPYGLNAKRSQGAPAAAAALTELAPARRAAVRAAAVAPEAAQAPRGGEGGGHDVRAAGWLRDGARHRTQEAVDARGAHVTAALGAGARGRDPLARGPGPGAPQRPTSRRRVDGVGRTRTLTHQIPHRSARPGTLRAP